MAFNLRRGITKKEQTENAIEMRKISNGVEANLKIDFNNRRVCITGTIPGLTRCKAQVILREKFPEIRFDHNVSFYTDFLITGHGVGQTKLTQANKNGTTIIEASKIFN